MKKILEKASLLALSTMLVSTFAISPAIPQMIDHFAREGIAASQVENLITVTSFAIMAALLMNSLIVRFISERNIIILGLLLLAIGGSMPMFLSAFPMIFLARILLGLGIGLINARAINIIGNFFTGQERVQMMGLRLGRSVGKCRLDPIGGMVDSIWLATSLYGLSLCFGCFSPLFIVCTPRRVCGT